MMCKDIEDIKKHVYNVQTFYNVYRISYNEHFTPFVWWSLNGEYVNFIGFGQILRGEGG